MLLKYYLGIIFFIPFGYSKYIVQPQLHHDNAAVSTKVKQSKNNLKMSLSNMLAGMEDSYMNSMQDYYQSFYQPFSLEIDGSEH